MSSMFRKRDWDDADRHAWRAFIESSTGERLIAELWWTRPAGTGASVEAAALSGSKLDGFLQCLQTLHDLAYGAELVGKVNAPEKLNDTEHYER